MTKLRAPLPCHVLLQLVGKSAFKYDSLLLFFCHKFQFVTTAYFSCKPEFAWTTNRSSSSNDGSSNSNSRKSLPPHLLAGVPQGGRLPDHLPDDEAGGDEHGRRRGQQHADRVGHHRVVADVLLVLPQLGGTHHQQRGIHLQHRPVREGLVANLEGKVEGTVQ